MTAVHLTVKDEPSAAATVRRAIDWMGREHGLSDEECFDLKLAATEALANALRHGSRAGGAVSVLLERRDDMIELEVQDTGAPHVAPTPEPDPDRGRGLPLIEALADDVEFGSVGDGTRVRIRMRIGRDSCDRSYPVL